MPRHDGPPDSRRIKPVKLADVPKPDRMRAARKACRYEEDPWERLRILMLAEEPGDLVAWIAR